MCIYIYIWLYVYTWNIYTYIIDYLHMRLDFLGTSRANAQGLPDLSDADFALPASIELQLVEEGSGRTNRAGLSLCVLFFSSE